MRLGSGIFALAFCWVCMSTIAVFAQLPAFPGAEGPGADASGGRGGDVYHVTNLLDDHDGTIPGSLRYGLKTAPASGRTIVFDVGGTINLVADEHNSTHTWLRSGDDNFTIAGQTAPGPGITIIGQGAKLSGDNWILRHVKFRPGQDQSRPGVLTNDGITNNLQNSIIDHVSVSWADDEGLSSTDFVNNSTVQYSIIGEGLNYNNHSFGALISSENDDANIGYHHNLFIHNRSRNPRLGSEKGTGANTSFTNNVVYNWYGRAGYSIDSKPSRTNFLGNYYIAGEDTRSTDTVFYSPDTNTVIHHADTNYVDMNENGSIDGSVFDFTGQQFSGTYLEAATPFNVPSGHVQSAPEAVDQVLDYVGSNWWDRDPIDERLADDVRNGTGVTIDNITDAPQDPSYSYDSEGYPIYGVTTRPVDFDVDGDGMPGWWEEKHGLDPNTPDNNGDFDGDSYTNLEEYLNELGAFPAPTEIEWLPFSGRFEESGNWGISQTIPVNTFTNWQPSRFDTAVMASANATLDSVGQHVGTLKVAPEPGNGALLTIAGGWLEVADALEIATASNYGEVKLQGGKLRVSTLSKGPSGYFTFTGGTLAADQVLFDLVNDGGTIAPGDSAGLTTVIGNLTLNSGILDIELGGTTAGTEFDALSVTGDVLLGGTLDVSLIESYALSAEQTFKILDVGGTLTGQFSGLAEGALVGNFGEDLYITYQGGDGNDVELYTLNAFLPEDLNMDGFVDGLDLGILLSNWNQSTTPDQGELNGTPPVDSLDLGLLLGSWNPPPVAAAAVPEPIAIYQFMVGLALVLLRVNSFS